MVTRHNDRSLRTRSGSWVKNGDRWVVRSVDPDGGLLVARATRRAEGCGTATLPAAYAGQHVQLGYAGTIHGAQGVTVDTTHTVLVGTESRQSLYVALSRGRFENHLYLGGGTTAAEGVALDTEPPDDGPREVLARILDRDPSRANLVCFGLQPECGEDVLGVLAEWVGGGVLVTGDTDGDLLQRP